MPTVLLASFSMLPRHNDQRIFAPVLDTQTLRGSVSHFSFLIVLQRFYDALLSFSELSIVIQMKQPIPGSEELLDRIKTALTPKRLPLLIGIDGADGCGKSSLASWLAWQLGMPTVHLDLYLSRLHPLTWRISEVGKAIKTRLGNRRPLIVEGILLLDVLELAQCTVDFLVFVTGGSEQSSLAAQVAAYKTTKQPHQLAHFTISGYEEPPLEYAL